jgi:hypothetical protein
VPEYVGSFVVHPVGAARTSVTDRSELTMVAKLTVDILVFTIINCVEVKLFLTGQASRTFLMI